MLVSVAPGSPTFKSAKETFDVDKDGTIRQIGRDHKRDPLLTEPAIPHTWDYVCKSLVNKEEKDEERPGINIADTVS